MPKSCQIELIPHRNYQFEVEDDGGDGWMVTIYASDGDDRFVLRTSVPGGLAELLIEARSRIDRRLDGQPWHHEQH